MLSALKPPRLKLPLIPISSEYERLLVDETAPDVGGGPMDLNATADEVLADATVADEGLAEKLMSRLFTTRGLILCTVLVVAALCVGVLRGAYESDEASSRRKPPRGCFSSRASPLETPTSTTRNAAAKDTPRSKKATPSPSRNASPRAPPPCPAKTTDAPKDSSRRLRRAEGSAPPYAPRSTRDRGWRNTPRRSARWPNWDA